MVLRLGEERLCLWAIAFLVCLVLAEQSPAHVLVGSVGLLHRSGDRFLGRLAPLSHFSLFLIECPLPQVDLTWVQAEFSFQVCFGLAWLLSSCPVSSLNSRLYVFFASLVSWQVGLRVTAQASFRLPPSGGPESSSCPLSGSTPTSR